MIPLRRPLILVSGAICLFIFYTFWRNSAPAPLTPVSEVYQPTSKVTDGGFDWAKLPQHYPVSSYAKLPTPPALAGLPRVQHAFELEDSEARRVRESRRSQVKEAFQRSWKAYRERAWLADELLPISGGNKTTFGGWAATLVDSLDTLWIMGFEPEFREAVDATLAIDFTNSTMTTINIFETTIRYLGGFIAAYDLSGDRRLLDKSVELAEMIYHAFDTPNRMPITRWKIHRAAAGERQEADSTTLSAEIGSLELELTRLLTQITGDPRWYDAGKRVMDVFDKQQGKSRVPGMWPLSVHAKKGDFFTGTVFTLGAMADSLYEYLPKMFALLGGNKMYKKLYTQAMDAAIEHTLFRPMLPDEADVLMTGPAHAHTVFRPAEPVEPEGQHLVCFAGAMFALGGRLLQRPKDIEIGRKLTDGCIWAYDNSVLGIMPEIFSMAKCADITSSCPWNETEWKSQLLFRSGNGAAKASSNTAITYAKEHKIPRGFTAIQDRRYMQRPETIESVFYLYRITGDQDYVEAAWRMFGNVQKYTATELAYAAIADITDPEAPKFDSMESFWTAETLKYYFLIFSEPDVISLDEWVLNTEAHPFRRPTAGGA